MLINALDFGQPIDYDVGEDVSTNTALEMEFYDPKGRLLTKTVALAPASLQILRYTREDGEILDSGSWRFRGVVHRGTERISAPLKRFEVSF